MNFRRFTSQTAVLLAFALALLPVTGVASTFGSLPSFVSNYSLPSTPVANWKSLLTVGLTGQGVTVGIVSKGIQDLSAAESAGAVPSNTVVTYPSGSVNSSHAVYSAMVIHEIAPNAKIVICNDSNLANCYTSLPGTYGVNVVADNYDEGAVNINFAYGDSTSNSQNRYHVSDINANPSVLFFLSGSDSYGTGFFQGNWVPYTMSVHGTSQTVENFGKVSGGTNAGYETMAQAPSGLSSFPVLLKWEDTNTTEGASFGLEVYDANGNLVGSSSQGCSSIGYSSSYTCAVASGAAPYQIYVYNNGPTGLSGNVKLKLYVGNGGGYTNASNWLNYVTQGGTTPFIPGAGPNAFVVTGAESDTTIYPTSGTGPLLAFYTPTDSYKTFDYPSLTGDWCLTVPKVSGLGGEFCGNSNSAPELAAEAALLLQAGISPSNLESALKSNAMNPVKGQDIWGPVWGYGYPQLLQTLQSFVQLPSPSINNGFGITLAAGASTTLSGACAVPSGYSVSGYTWNFGDGSSGKGQTVNHSWSSAGTYTVSLNCSDNQSPGYSSPSPATLTVDVTSKSTSVPGSGSGGGGSFGLTTLWVLCMLALSLVYLRRLQEKGLIGKTRDKRTGGNDH